MVRPSFISNFNKLPKAFLLAFLFILTGWVVELLLPINFFNFRLQEALSVNILDYILPGPFYPNIKISMVEQGDIGHHTKFAVKKNVEWQTDRYGYRKADIISGKYKIVIVGDSETAGVRLTQKDMLSEVLEKRLGVGVYPLAPANINTFLYSQRFINYPPDIVILECIERDITILPEIETSNKALNISWQEKYLKWLLSKNQSIAISLDRLSKNAMYRFLWARAKEGIHRIVEEFSPPKLPGNNSATNMLFYQGVVANKDVPAEEIDRAVRIIKSYEEAINKRGMRFIFLPVPNKENVYYDLLPGKKKPVFLEQLISRLKSQGIEAVDIEQTFEKARQENNTLLYHTDDSHWNAEGVKLTADLIEQAL